MTNDDDLLQAAIIDQINAELGAAGISMKDFAKQLGRPYDSTRNYLKKERSMPLGIFIECATALDITPDEIIARARRRLR
jgi:lambda repressor-like predicted transcriptional regulator